MDKIDKSVDIKFSKDGEGYYLTFHNGTRSPVYYSKQAGMNDPDLIYNHENGLISEIEFENINTLIIGAKIRYFEPESKGPYKPARSAFFDKNQNVICCRDGTCAVISDLNNEEEVRFTLDILIYTGNINSRECEELKKEFKILWLENLKGL